MGRLVYTAYNSRGYRMNEDHIKSLLQAVKRPFQQVNVPACLETLRIEWPKAVRRLSRLVAYNCQPTWCLVIILNKKCNFADSIKKDGAHSHISVIRLFGQSQKEMTRSRTGW